MCKRETQTSGTRTSANTPCKFVERSTHRGSPPLRMGSLGHHGGGGEPDRWRLGQKSLSPRRSDLLKIYPRARNHLSIDGFDHGVCIKFREVKISKGLVFNVSLLISFHSTQLVPSPPPRDGEDLPGMNISPIIPLLFLRITDGIYLSASFFSSFLRFNFLSQNESI